MKRLVSILLMNAWGGLRHKASLPTVSMVGFGVVVLLVASTVTAGASPDSSLPGVGTVAHIVHSVTSPITSMLSSPPPQKPSLQSKPKAQTADNTQQSTSSTNTSGSTASTSPNSGTNNATATSKAGSQTPAATLTLATLQCNAGQTTYTLEVPSAQLNLQTPTSEAGTITWYWETRTDSGASTGQIATSTSTNQPISANASTVTLTVPQAQWLYTAVSNNTNDYSFRLHVTSPVDVTSNWVSVPQSANGTCPQVTQ